MYRGFVFDLKRLLKGLVNKDEGDKTGKALLSESSDISNEGTKVKGHDEENKQPRPEPYPHTKRHEVPILITEIRHVTNIYNTLIYVGDT